MTKELYVSSTPHETKVGLVEDDQLAEIYLERENEYTLAGSIYKGRVTRVLPGMQSAFVDIGLERDAFLYVSDFMELEDADEVDELPASQPAGETRYQPRVEAPTSGGEVAGAKRSPSRTQNHVLKSRSRRHRAANPRARQSAEAKKVAGGADAGAAAAAAESACRNRSLSGQPASLRGKRRANPNAVRVPSAPSATSATTAPSAMTARASRAQ